MSENLMFEMSHLDKYAVISEPGFLLIKNNSKLNYDDMYTADGHNRWIMNLKAVTVESLGYLKLMRKLGPLYYSTAGKFLMTGALWENQVLKEEDLPIKGEEVGCIFNYVKGVLRCTNITVIPRKKPKLYIHSKEVYNDIQALENIIKGHE
jgi:hypothetical protein